MTVPNTEPPVPKAAMTVAEYAVHRGCSDSYVRRMRRDQRLALTADKLIDVAASDARLAATTDPLRGGDRTAAAGSDFPGAGGQDSDVDGAAVGGVYPVSLREAMRRERLARARLAELELGETAKQLVRVDDVHRVVFTLARQAMENLRAMPGRLRGALAKETDPVACGALLDAEVAKVCEAMQRAAAKGPTEAPNAGGEA